MTQPDHVARRSRPHGSKPRGDSTRPASGRRNTDRRPYPTAPTTTRISPAKPGSATARVSSRDSAQTPTPATVWTAGAVPIDLDSSWPVPIVNKVVAAFSKPGERVALAPWPAVNGRRPLGVVGAIARVPEADLAAALKAVDDLDRSSRVVRLGRDNVVGDGASADTDLLVVSLRPEDGGDHTSDLVALVAARLLRVGGILAVVTHSDWSRGELIDPTGAVVASAQNADLLYLQHIVVIDVPVRDGQLATELTSDMDGPAVEQHARAMHRAAVRRLPAPHRRIHSDVLVFVQPHEHEPRPAEQVFASGVIR